MLRELYNVLNHYFPERTLYHITERVLIDESMFTPANLFFVFTAANFLEGKTTEQVKQAIKTEFPAILSRCWIFW